MVLPPNYVNVARRDALEARVTAVEGSGPGGGGAVNTVNGVAPDGSGDVDLDLDDLGVSAPLAAKANIATSDLPVMFATSSGWPLSRAAFVAVVGGSYSGPIIYDRVLYPSTADPTDQVYGDRLRDRV